MKWKLEHFLRSNEEEICRPVGSFSCKQKNDQSCCEFLQNIRPEDDIQRRGTDDVNGHVISQRASTGKNCVMLGHMTINVSDRSIRL